MDTVGVCGDAGGAVYHGDFIGNHDIGCERR